MAQRRQQTRERLVEALQVGRIASDVVAMSVHRVEINEVDEDEALVCLAQRPGEALHSLGIAGRVRRAGDAAASKQIIDLSDGNDGNTVPGQSTEQRLRGRLQRVIMT